MSETSHRPASTAARALLVAIAASPLSGGCGYEVTYSAAPFHARRLASRPELVHILGFVGATRELVAVQIGREVHLTNARTGRAAWQAPGRGQVDGCGRLLIQDGRSARVLEFDSHDTPRELFTLGRQSMRVAALGAGGEVLWIDDMVWSLPAGRLVGRVPEDLSSGVARTFSDAARLVAWQDRDHVVHVWNVAEGRTVLSRPMDCALARLAFGPGAERLLLYVPPPPPAAVRAGAETLLPAADVQRGRVEVVDLRSAEVVWTRPARPPGPLLTGDRHFALMAAEARPRAGADRRTEVLRLADGRHVTTLDGRALASPPGTARVIMVAAPAGQDRPRLRHVVLPSGRILAERALQTGWTGAVVGPEGNLIALRTRCAWVVETVKEGKELLSVRGGNRARPGGAPFGDLCFSDHGCCFALVAAGGDLLLFDLRNAYCHWSWPPREPRAAPDVD